MFLIGSQNEHYKYLGGRKMHLLDSYDQFHELDPFNFGVFALENCYKNMSHRNATVPFWPE